MRVLSVLLGLALFVAAGNAQDAPLKTLRDVRSGMDRETVLTALSNSYSVTAPGSGKLAFSDLQPRADAQRQGESLDQFLERVPSGQITFWEGKVGVVVVHLQPILKSADDIRFAKQLFFGLFNEAEPVNVSSDPDVQRKVEQSAGQIRQIVAPIKLLQIHNPTVDLYQLDIEVNGHHFALAISSAPGREASVALSEQVFDTLPAQLK